jgi:hypothetical protein
MCKLAQLKRQIQYLELLGIKSAGQVMVYQKHSIYEHF